MWRWAIVARDSLHYGAGSGAGLPVNTGIKDSKGRAQLAAEAWHAEHVRPQPTLGLTEEPRHGQRTDTPDDLPF